jgi:nucleotide-binding universal stress UspA family protein
MNDAGPSEHSIFQRILCGVDGTSASLVAVRQAMRLQHEGGALQLTAVANLAKAAHAGMAATHAAELLQGEAEAALAEAAQIATTATGKLVDGEPVAVLLREAEAQQATLVAVGTHGRGRAAGMLRAQEGLPARRGASRPLSVCRGARGHRTCWRDHVR